MAGGSSGLGPALKTGTNSDDESSVSGISTRGDASPNPGFVSVTKFDYNVMRASQVIVVVGICVMIIKALITMCRNCNRKAYSYSKVKYNTDITTDEEI